MESNKFSSDGFDLDAMPNLGDGDVIYEVGGGATVEQKEEPAVTNGKKQDENETVQSPIAQSEDFKAQGNDEFKKKNYLEACDMYTAAIEACPGMTGKEILKLRDEFDEREHAKMLERNRLDAQKRRQELDNKVETESGDKKTYTENESEEAYQPAQFEAPSHPHGENLAIYHCNRAACKLYLENYEEALPDCDVAILLRPNWPKAYVRRSMAQEKLEKTDLALADAKKALELDKTNATVRKTVARLQKLEDERMEKLKEETIGKLKDLGNSLLSNFGLSLDNFKAQQDPNTGSYSISFDQNASSK